MKHGIGTLILSGLLTLLAGCGSGGVGIVADGGIGGTGVSTGTVTGFGSVIVNGTAFEVDNNTQISVEGQAATQDDLKVGFVVRVEADFDSNTARRIDYTDTVRGTIDAPTINPDTLRGTFTVLGQTVRTNGLTIFDNVDVSALQGADVSISGIRDASGDLVASIVQERTAPGSDFSVVGPIQNLDTANRRFEIQALTVDFSGTELPQGVAEDAIVQVKGSDFDPSSVTLVANSVEKSVLDLSPRVGDRIEIEGFVSAFTSLSNFAVNDLAVDASNATIEAGAIRDLQRDVRVEVEGRIDNNGVLQVDKIVIRPDDTLVRIEATVEAVDTNAGTVTLLGIAVRVTAQTRLEDNSDAKARPFALGDINPGDRIEMRGFLEQSHVVASRLAREDPDPGEEVILQGPVDQGGVDSDNQTLRVLGITLRTNNETEFENDSSTFFNTVAEGTLVKAKWAPFVSLTDPVDELELEDDGL